MLNGVYWVRQNGPMKDAHLAHIGRKKLLELRAEQFPRRDRLRFHRLMDAVNAATTGSCVRWNADRIHAALLEFQGKEKPKAETEKSLPGRFEAAYQSYQLAAGQLASEDCDEPSDIDAHEWLKEHGPSEYELPDFNTWVRYVRAGRHYYRQQKNSPVRGRTSRSAVAPDGL